MLFAQDIYKETFENCKSDILWAGCSSNAHPTSVQPAKAEVRGD